MRKLIVLMLCLVPLSALAGDENQQATILFKQTEYRKALKAVQKVLRSKDAGPNDLLEAYRIQGLSYAAMGRKKQALGAFRRLLAINPEFKMSKAISPKLTPPFYQAVGMASERKPITLVHQPKQVVEKLPGHELLVILESNPLRMVASVRVRYQTPDGKDARISHKVKGAETVLIPIPADYQGDEINYVLEAANPYGGILAVATNEGRPFKLQTKAARAAAMAVVSPVVVKKEPPLPEPVTRHLPEKDEGEDELVIATPWYKTWWFWTVVGVAVAGAATGTAVALTSGSGGSDGPFEYGIRVR